MLFSKKYLISDLADLAGVSPRTIRYYTEEGLIPQPEVDGKYAYYTSNHLTRLNLIKVLKDNFLPLKEIRLLLSGMSDEEIEAKVGEPGSFFSIQERAMIPFNMIREDQNKPEGSSALDYISRVMGEKTSTRNRPEPPPHHQSLPKTNLAGSTLPSSLTKSIAEPHAPIAVGEPERWEKFILADGVELLIRQPADRKTQYSLHQLIGLARKLFS